jgi:hypothetical protein
MTVVRTVNPTVTRSLKARDVSEKTAELDSIDSRTSFQRPACRESNIGTVHKKATASDRVCTSDSKAANLVLLCQSKEGLPNLDRTP